MFGKYCCAACFGDSALTREIIPRIIEEGKPSRRRSVCGYCGTKDIDTIEPSTLMQWFNMLLECYTPYEKGKSLALLLKEDWHLFSHKVMDEAHVKELLGDILKNGEIVRHPFVFNRSYLSIRNTPQHWDALRGELMHQNRWFPDVSLHLDDLGEILTQLMVSSKHLQKTWYRARLLPGETPFSIEEMGAPPRHLTKNGRANPAGISYLYLGSSEETAISEVRPHTGEKACVATFSISTSRPLNIVDLRNPRFTVSPFLSENAEQIATLYASFPLLEKLKDELTKPVHPTLAPFEYIPSQYLCEFIKSQNYDGVIYKSSVVNNGVNLALFNPDLAVGNRDVKTFRVGKITVEIAQDYTNMAA